MSHNAQFKRGIVKENDPKRGMSRVEFKDEDGVVSFWLAWNMPAAGGSKIYNAPDLESQVNCLVDWRGEDGIILGARYSEKDTPPTQNGKETRLKMEGGLDISYDKAGGTLSIKAGAKVTIEAPQIVLKGDIDLGGEGGELVHRKGDADSSADTAVGSASKVRAV